MLSKNAAYKQLKKLDSETLTHNQKSTIKAFIQDILTSSEGIQFFKDHGMSRTQTLWKRYGAPCGHPGFAFDAYAAATLLMGYECCLKKDSPEKSLKDFKKHVDGIDNIAGLLRGVLFAFYCGKCSVGKPNFGAMSHEEELFIFNLMAFRQIVKKKVEEHLTGFFDNADEPNDDDFLNMLRVLSSRVQ